MTVEATAFNPYADRPPAFEDWEGNSVTVVPQRVVEIHLDEIPDVIRLNPAQAYRLGRDLMAAAAELITADDQLAGLR